MAGQSRAKEGQGAVGPAICTADVPAAEMACGVDLGTSVLERREGSKVLANWATDIAVGRGIGDKAVVVENVLGTIASGGGGDCTVASALGGRRRLLPKPPHPPLSVLWVSMARDAMARLLLSSSTLLSVGVSN